MLRWGTMLVLVGSKNPAKVKAVEKAFAKYFKEFEVKGIEVESNVSAQPLSLDETVQGAVNRAKSAWRQSGKESDYGVGIEAGLFPVKGTKTGYLDAAAVAIFDGKETSLGLSPAFEYPKKVAEKILKEGKEVSDVFAEFWNENTRDELGAIGRLSLGKVPRSMLQEMGLIMALAPIVNKKYYG